MSFKIKKMKNEIHCPISGCLYSVGSERHFTGKKFLNQHIAKVHAEKKYVCAKCNKCFGLDWWRKHHEKTCGIEWECTCGIKYMSRETLLTHARRNDHKLPDCVLSTDKLKKAKINKMSAENPIVVLVQPIIQNFACIQTSHTSAASLRPILPKVSPPVHFSLPMNVRTFLPVSSIVPSNTADLPSEDTVPIQTAPVHSLNGNIVLPSSDQLLSSPQKADKVLENGHYFQKTVATQTPARFDNPVKRQSQASQCTRRSTKPKYLGIESTHTQTSESTVVKIKKKRSRRKSVAITTEPSLLSDCHLNNDHSLWPGFNDFFLQNADNLGIRSYKNSASTQTSTHKVLCDSETITDEDLLKLHWNNPAEVKNTSSTFVPIDDAVANETLVISPKDYELPEMNIFYNESIVKPAFPEAAKPLDTVNEDFQNVSMSKTLENSQSSLFSVFGNCPKQDVANKIAQPSLSDIHTQTIASAVLNYNMLANMETQTTDDFTLSDLEFLDTETQTPWEDFPNIDSPLQTDQLSIEIQTDFSSFGQGLNQNPYEFLNDVQSIIEGYSSKECLGVNCETQTQDKFSFPQLTNTESQTLDLSDFIFDSISS